ncbi:SDR family NAD(P)-dependent oxidoreductase [Alphaproteobacteria bacterium]|nr:SDR family NAD(P)-dependent oxidoreductase [Alphaproteobacteria bacterium]
MSKSKIALITGANRGLGFEIARQLSKNHNFEVILGIRNQTKAQEALKMLKIENLNVDYFQLDITSEESVLDFKNWFLEKKVKLDVLINNAGILLERKYTEKENIEIDGLEVDINIVKKIIDTNLLGTLRVIQKIHPLINEGGRIINLSSQMGQFSWAGSNMIGYRLSKTALNALTANLSTKLLEKKITINSLCPGWVLTDMGSKFAQISVEEGAKTAVWLATEFDNKVTGKFFFEKKQIPW